MIINNEIAESIAKEIAMHISQTHKIPLVPVNVSINSGIKEIELVLPKEMHYEV